MSSTNKLATLGAFWTVGGYFIALTLRFGSSLILTRLLTPDLFGLISLANSFVIALSFFSDLGISGAMIRSKRWQDQDFLNTAWTIQAIRSIVLWFLTFLISYPLSIFYDKPILLWLIPTLGFTVVIQGFVSTSIAVIRRKLQTSKLIIIELINQLLSTAVTIIWAIYSPSIWAFLGGLFTSSLVQLILSYRLDTGERNRFAWERHAVKEIFSFSVWTSISTANTFLAYQSDKLFIGKLFPIGILGVYGLAFTVSEIPRSILSKLTGMVVLPLISQNLDLPRQQLQQKIAKKRLLLILGTMVPVLFLCGFGDILMKIYLPTGAGKEMFRHAQWMLPILAFGFWFNLLAGSVEQTLVALGKLKGTALAGFSKFIYNLIGIPLVAAKFGLVGVIILIAGNDVPYYICITYGLWKQKLVFIRQDIQVTLLFVGLLGIILAVRYSLGGGLPIDGIYNVTY